MSSKAAVPKPPLIDEDAPVTLNVGGTKFVTAPDTLARSGFLRAAFSPENLQDDGSLFVDYDPKIFEHVLNYLRTGILPSCFGGVDKGYTNEFIMTLKHAAKYFQVDRLYEWLDKKQYLETAKIETITEEIEHDNGVSTRAYPADELVEHHVWWAAKKVPICPRGIPVHTPNASVPQCGQQCRSAASQGAPTFKSVMVPSSVVVVRKKVVFDDSICQS
ncbi:hypothetical protein IWX90DRAFT_411671 [Phyllosticta citrichinensis]|uniref:BTB domain-containing protein n=1 Tax=Phyllosticta citrichinensis TaxID=1130410 RepID=A0ABR1Y2A4_9PEZI